MKTWSNEVIETLAIDDLQTEQCIHLTDIEVRDNSGSQ